MTKQYVLVYFLVCLVCMAISLIIIRQMNQDMGSRLEVRTFRLYLACYYAFAATNALWVWINYGFLRLSGYPVSVINLIALCAASYYWFKFAEIRMNPNVIHSRFFNIIATAPLCAVIILVASTPITKLVFYYNEKNEFIHGPLYLCIFLLAMIYISTASFRLVLNLRLAKTASQRRQQYILILFILFPITAGLVDLVVPNLPITELALLFGTFLIYSSMQKSKIYQDALTGLSNRRYLDDYLLERIACSSYTEPLYFFLADIDDFKQINDRYGHMEGDRALQTVAHTLRSFSTDVRCHVARWAGDEFAIIADSGFTAYPEYLISSINASLEKEASRAHLRYPLHLSIGYSFCTSPGSSVTELVHQADQMMYLAKGRHISAGRESVVW